MLLKHSSYQSGNVNFVSCGESLFSIKFVHHLAMELDRSLVDDRIHLQIVDYSESLP